MKPSPRKTLTKASWPRSVATMSAIIWLRVIITTSGGVSRANDVEPLMSRNKTVSRSMIPEMSESVSSGMPRPRLGERSGRSGPRRSTTFSSSLIPRTRWVPAGFGQVECRQIFACDQRPRQTPRTGKPHNLPLRAGLLGPFPRAGEGIERGRSFCLASSKRPW